MRLHLFLAATVTLLPASIALSKPAPDVTPIKRWIDSQKEVKTFYSEFQQERQLRALKKPIVKPGRLWFAAPDSFRWELGQPPATIALQKSQQDLLVLEPAKKQGKRYTVDELREEGRARGAAFLEAGFPRTYETFDRIFKVTDTTLKNNVYEVTASIRDRKTAVALRKVVFHIDAKSYDLRQLYLRFRDSSSITTTFGKTQKNPRIPASKFEIDLSGYKLKQKRR